VFLLINEGRRKEERKKERKKEERKRSRILLLVTRLCLVTQIRRLCLQFSCKMEPEPLDIGSQVEPRNHLKKVAKLQPDTTKPL
jgi:hypothetical protein